MAASTALIVLAHALIAWIYSVTCASMTAEFTAMPTTDTPCIPSASAILTATAAPTSMNDIPRASPNFTCSHCTRNFNSRIGQVCH
ncbi:unnamed protein product [Schistocephalus solidus]|uniref:Secreted protein n=1 Tax=Schistocephalus solidus TaxID=70667 RepID=A0A183SJG2_SCHSO|nr:unnamed protein product [Schistocephalus solidus]